MAADKVYLTGFMTSGKSTIGPILANSLGWDFFDLDQVIEAAEGRKIAEIFEVRGEKEFRKIERKYLSDLSINKFAVIALGGGAVADDESLNHILQNGKMVYLKSSAEAIYRRIKNNLDRPLFKDLVAADRPRNEFIERINSMLREREKYYNRADLIVNTDSDSIGRTIDFIIKKLNRLIDEKS